MEKVPDNIMANEEDAHSYFMHPEKPGQLLCIPMRDTEAAGMFCYFAQFLPEDDDTDIWNISFPDLPGCLSCGRGLKQAMANAIDALEGYLSVAKKEGMPIAKPSDFATAVVKAQTEDNENEPKPGHAPLFLLVPAWPKI